MIEALVIGGALFLIVSALLSVFIFLLETVPFLAIAVLIGLIIGIFVSFNRVVERHINKKERMEDLNIDGFFLYILTNLTVAVSIFIMVGFIGSFISPSNNGIHLKEGNLFIYKEIRKKIYKNNLKRWENEYR